jgi:GH24 family phage-related lysozyme (muramidase)
MPVDTNLISLARFTARREGIVLVPYRDGNGFSIGCGHHLGKLSAVPHLQWTVDQAFSTLMDDLAQRVEQVQKYLKVAISSNQVHALVDLYYQGGTDGLKAVATIINSRNPDDPQSVLKSDREAAREFLNWDTNAAGDHLAGLLKRRALEVAMFIAGDYGSDLAEIPLWEQVDPSTHKVRFSDMKQYKIKETDIPQKSRKH